MLTFRFQLVCDKLSTLATPVSTKSTRMIVWSIETSTIGSSYQTRNHFVALIYTRADTGYSYIEIAILKQHRRKKVSGRTSRRRVSPETRQFPSVSERPATWLRRNNCHDVLRQDRNMACVVRQSEWRAARGYDNRCIRATTARPLFPSNFSTSRTIQIAECRSSSPIADKTA